jgi:adhesin transport system outer membrane protein
VNRWGDWLNAYKFLDHINRVVLTGVTMKCVAVKFVLFVAAISVAAPVCASELRVEVERLLESHGRILASEADVDVIRERGKVAKGSWYPTVDVLTSYGWERQNKGQGVADTSMPPSTLELSLTQLVWDFGATNAAIDRANLEKTQALNTLESTRQNVMLEAINAHLNVYRQRQLLEFNQGSIDNVKRQMKLEDARVQRGSGLATDVLQAKGQLAGLEATRIRIRGALRTATNRYRAVFGDTPPPEKDRKKRRMPALPLDLLPPDMDEAIAIAIEENPRLKASYLGTFAARKSVDETTANELLPKINLKGEQNYKHDEGGTIGGKQETLIKLELSYSLNLGLTELNSINAAEFSQTSIFSRFKDEKNLIEERVRNAWDDFETAQARVEQLRNQTNIASEFLELARRERQLGNRSLIDVLAGETALINATSDAASAEVDVTQAVFRLLAGMGRLKVDAIRD